MSKFRSASKLFGIASACLLGALVAASDAQAKGQCGEVTGRCDLYADLNMFRSARIGEALALVGETLHDDAIAVAEQCPGRLPEVRYVGIDGDRNSSFSIVTHSVASHTSGKGNVTAALGGLSEGGSPKVIFLDATDSDEPIPLHVYTDWNAQAVNPYSADAVGASVAFLPDGRSLMVHPVRDGAEPAAVKLLSNPRNGPVTVLQEARFAANEMGDTKPMACVKFRDNGVICTGKRTLMGARLQPNGSIETWQSNVLSEQIENRGQFSAHLILNQNTLYVQKTILAPPSVPVSVVYSYNIASPQNPLLETMNYVTHSNRPTYDIAYANMVLFEQGGQQFLLASAPGGELGNERVSKFLTFAVDRASGSLDRGPNGQGGTSGTADELGEGYIFGVPLGDLGETLISYRFGRLNAHSLANPAHVGVLPVVSRGAHNGCHTFPPGDLNCDGLVNNEDIDPFVHALTDPYVFDQSVNYQCTFVLADSNLDGRVNNLDINGFVQRLMGNP